MSTFHFPNPAFYQNSSRPTTSRLSFCTLGFSHEVTLGGYFSSIFGLDFPLGVQTLVLACSVMMMMMESNYAAHVM